MLSTVVNVVPYGFSTNPQPAKQNWQHFYTALSSKRIIRCTEISNVSKKSLEPKTTDNDWKYNDIIIVLTRAVYLHIMVCSAVLVITRTAVFNMYRC